MVEPITLVALTALVVKHGPAWLDALRGTVLDKGREVAIDKGRDFATGKGERFMQRVLQLDEKEQLRHLQRALKSATERGLAKIDTLEERDQYKDILRTLSREGPQGAELRREVMRLFSLAEIPDLTALSEIYNSRCRFYNAAHSNIDAGLYLNSFFNALLGELYADVYFRAQLSAALQLRAANTMQQSLLDIIDVLKGIGEMLDDGYSAQDLARDKQAYTEHIERTERNLKIVGVVPKDQNPDPEISGIFVPLRISISERPEGMIMADGQTEQGSDISDVLEQSPCLVLLGGPGSGKSTLTKHLAWCHAAANKDAPGLAETTLLTGNPLPLRIELRRLNDERKRANYDFLSFAAQFLLKREGVEIDPRMFKELLERRCMLLLFDGLDEVATVHERLELVKEIENFALCYPGNRVLVTSRPVGYELAPISHPLFSRAEVQSFNDEQIKQFLENWYTAVLRLSPIPQKDREELDLLLTTLKDNTRLHKLAENPLLLTVITQLHRSERLPDRRILLYDRCADLLLQTWAKLKGTDKRWENMKMDPDDQYTCVAYLGFVLHSRAQEAATGQRKAGEDTTVDVTLRFLSDNVERFINQRNLISERAEQHKEARRFIELAKAEAGLIVERGRDESGEELYSFVHRTFQEYFAAMDVYKRYLQEEEPQIISDFLREHMHDPHWREVILLLLGKLLSKPVTKQLQQVLQGKIKSRRSNYTDIVQQDLFFVCDCLIEEIRVEPGLVDTVLARLCKVIRTGRFRSQRKQALEYLGKLMQTRQYTGQGRNELVAFATKDDVLDIMTRFDAVLVLYLSSFVASQERQLADQALSKLLEGQDLSIEQMRETVVSLYGSSPPGTEERQYAFEVLRKLLERQDLTVEQMRETAALLAAYTSSGSTERQYAIEVLRRLLERQDLTVEQMRQAAIALFESSGSGTAEGQHAFGLLRELLERQDLTVEQARETAMSLYRSSRRTPSDSIVWRQYGFEVLRKLLEGSELTVEQARETAMSLYSNSSPGSEEERLAAAVLLKLVEQGNEGSDEQNVYRVLRTMVPEFHRLPVV